MGEKFCNLHFWPTLVASSHLNLPFMFPSPTQTSHTVRHLYVRELVNKMASLQEHLKTKVEGSDRPALLPSAPSQIAPRRGPSMVDKMTCELKSEVTC